MYLVIDVGTHSVRAGLLAASGAISSLHQRPLKLQRMDQPSRVEQDPLEMQAALLEVVQAALAAADRPVAGAGLACQRSSVLAWNTKSGRAVSPILSWQDTRCGDAVQGLKQYEAEVRERSGLVLSPHYGASKLSWLQQRYGNSSGITYSPLVSFLIHTLTGSDIPLCDETNAGRTQLWNLTQRRWDPTLARLFNVDVALLPQVKPTYFNYGDLTGVDAAKVSLHCVMGDQNAALLGAIAKADSKLLVNCGTGAFVLGYQRPNAGNHKGLLSSVVCSTGQSATYTTEGTVNGAGAALSWLVQTHAIKSEAWLFQQLPAWLASTEPPRLLFINTLGGLGSPFWKPSLAPKFVSLPADAEHHSSAEYEPNIVPNVATDHSIEAKAVAIVESIVFLLGVNIKLMQTRGSPPGPGGIVITGGLARLDGLCQKLANLCQTRCSRLAQHETTLLGVGVAVSKSQVTRSEAFSNQFEPREDPQLLRRFEVFCAALDGV